MKIIILMMMMMITMFLYSCGNDEQGSDEDNSTTYLINLLAEENIESVDEVTVKVALYGFHTKVQDNSATLLSEVERAIIRLPSILHVEWPDNAYQLIDNPPVTNEENAGYYFNVRIDMDNDGLLCSNDYIIDSDKIDQKIISGKPSASISIPVKRLTNFPCEQF